MVIAALKTLTWGTVAAAVLSAVLLASSGGPGESLRSARPPGSVQPEPPGRADSAANAAQQQRAATGRAISSH